MSISFPFSGGATHQKKPTFLHGSCWCLVFGSASTGWTTSLCSITLGELKRPCMSRGGDGTKRPSSYFLFPRPNSIMATDTSTSVKKGTTVGRASPEEREAQGSRYHWGSVSQKITGGRKFERKSRGRKKEPSYQVRDCTN